LSNELPFDLNQAILITVCNCVLPKNIHITKSIVELGFGGACDAEQMFEKALITQSQHCRQSQCNAVPSMHYAMSMLCV